MTGFQMQFRRLDPTDDARFREAATERFEEAVKLNLATGDKLEVDLQLWHPVYLRQLAAELDRWALSRMSLANADE